LVKLGMDHQRP